MISIIICSRNKDIPSELKQNIADTIGTAYDLVVIDNSRNQYSIFSAYNEGVRRAKGDMLCFMHEDVLFKNCNWGERVIKHFQNNVSLGILGVAGTHFLSSYPMYWSESPIISEHYLSNDYGMVERCYKENFYKKDGLAEVIACDGMCFFSKKELFEEIIFDENTYSGFHMYDMDICMQAILNRYQVCVCNDILIEHQWSERDVKTKKGMELFYPNLVLFSKKWREELPMVKGIDFLPEYTIQRLNNMVGNKCDAIHARSSWSYRIGALMLKPFKVIKDLFR